MTFSVGKCYLLNGQIARICSFWDCWMKRLSWNMLAQHRRLNLWPTCCEAATAQDCHLSRILSLNKIFRIFQNTHRSQRRRAASPSRTSSVGRIAQWRCNTLNSQGVKSLLLSLHEVSQSESDVEILFGSITARMLWFWFLAGACVKFDSSILCPGWFFVCTLLFSWNSRN